ncbi:MAG: metal-dependent phosphohydrolase, partial [Firmicutes bacterium]|nr:metal-dependent phosphohydrolase [Bacillota bacterium]
MSVKASDLKSWRKDLRLLQSWLQTDRARRSLVLLGTWFVIAGIFAVTVLSQRISVQVGDVAPRSVYAPYGVVDEPATAKARKQAENAVPNVYTVNKKIFTQQQQTANHDFAVINALAADTTVPLNLRAQAAAEILPFGLSTVVWAH